MKRLNVCVIGAGSISDMHLQAYHHHPDVHVYAVCDTSQERAQQKADQYGISRVFSRVEDVFADERVDAVSICTRNDTHAALSIAALKAGKHVLVEKPLSITVAEAERVQAAAQKSGKVLQVGFVRRFASNTRVLKTFIDRGKLGDIYYAKASCLRRLGNPGGWFADKNQSGGGPLIDLGVHVIDICWYLMGKPKVTTISGHTYHRLGNRAHIENLSFYKAADYHQDENNVEDMANALITFENGASLMVDVSYTLHAKQDELHVKLYGTKGGAELEPELVIVSEEENTIVNVHPQMDHLTFDFEAAFQNEINAFVYACQSGTASIAPVADGVEMMKIVNGIYEAAEQGREVVLR